MQGNQVGAGRHAQLANEPGAQVPCTPSCEWPWSRQAAAKVSLRWRLHMKVQATQCGSTNTRNDRLRITFKTIFERNRELHPHRPHD